MKYLFISTLLCLCFLLPAQDTFSIVAIDEETGEVGSAGASCLDNNQFPGSGGAFIISDILPGKGAIHTQSFYLPQNQATARTLMEDGKSAAFIINHLQNSQNDAENNSSVRQYGIVSFNNAGQARSAAFTGSNCLDYKGQILGTYYAIQGNILLGPQVLDSMEARFINTEGTLADRLMAALQGANIPGADSRCLNEGVSSLSAFLRVAKTDDPEDNLYLDLNVPATAFGVEPIDSLQTLYDNFLLSTGTEELTTISSVLVYPNPAKTALHIAWKNNEIPVGSTVSILDASGKILLQKTITNDNEFVINHLDQFTEGLYFYQIKNNSRPDKSGKFLIKK